MVLKRERPYPWWFVSFERIFRFSVKETESNKRKINGDIRVGNGTGKSGCEKGDQEGDQIGFLKDELEFFCK